MTDAQRFRRQFPVFETTAYLNAGTEGPLPLAAVDAVRERVERDAAAGRAGRAYFEELMGLAARSRSAYASVLGAQPEEVALTGSTTDGINTVLGGLSFTSREEILTTDEEHPGLLAPLRLARVRHGVSIRVVPFAELPGEVRPSTRLIACSHVSWVGGMVADVPALVATGVPVLLDAAQGLGAVPVDVHAMGCDFYAASGQKWLCGPEGSGCLYVRPDRLDDLEPPWPGYSTLSNHEDILHSDLAEGAPRLDHGFPSALRSAWALASLGVLEDAGWDWIHERAAELAAQLASRLSERGLTVAPRGRSTLVSWSAGDPEGEVTRLAGEGFVVRSVPIGGLIRAAVGAWSSEEEIERLAEAAAASP
ncbi:MAG TPA: aminotransferase class V-fold PLP-dependent enzyme [Solirubrobacteraceae bacterium]|nr:aminotransferase class V-fold PLP-dependent enzyme [Solirubrobacteraceae bacterium]